VVGQKSTVAGNGIQEKRWRLQDMSKTKTHYLPNGKPYTGETHKVGATLMTGAKHTAQSKNLTHTLPKKK
jgi:hypothetical protein